MTHTEAKQDIGQTNGEAQTPISDHVRKFWETLTEEECVCLRIDQRRVIGQDAPDGPTVYWDMSAFNNDVGKALVKERADILAQVRRMEGALRAAKDDFASIEEYWNGGSESAVDAAEESRERASAAIKKIESALSPAPQGAQDVCPHCYGTGNDQNHLNDPGPCHHCEGSGDLPAPQPDAAPADVKQNFERFPKLAKWIERFANTNIGLNLIEWQKFTDALNEACAPASPLPAHDVIEAAAKAIYDLTPDHRTSSMGSPKIEWADASEGAKSFKREQASAALAAANLLRQSASVEDGRVPERECFWLIERKVTPPQYWCDLRGSGFTDDPWQAVRFKTEREAFDRRLRFAERERDECEVVEHVFINKISAPASPPVDAAGMPDRANLWNAAVECAAAAIRYRRQLLHSQFEALSIDREDAVYGICEEAILSIKDKSPIPAPLPTDAAVKAMVEALILERTWWVGWKESRLADVIDRTAADERIAFIDATLAQHGVK